MRIGQCCVLCGRDRLEIKRIILGIHGGVCPDCVYRYMAVLQSGGEASSSPEPLPVTPFPQQPRPFGLCAEEFAVPADFDAPLPDAVAREWE